MLLFLLLIFSFIHFNGFHEVILSQLKIPLFTKSHLNINKPRALNGRLSRACAMRTYQLNGAYYKLQNLMFSVRTWHFERKVYINVTVPKMPRTFLVRRTALQLNTPSSTESEEDGEYSEPSVNQNTGMFISYLFMHVNDDPYYLNINILNFPFKRQYYINVIILYRVVNKSFDKNRNLSVFYVFNTCILDASVSIPVTDKLIINHSYLCQNNSWSSNQITTQHPK